MAGFCLATGVQPSEYANLTGYEIEAYIAALQRQNSKG